jgi:hypothetical protein
MHLAKKNVPPPADVKTRQRANVFPKSDFQAKVNIKPKRESGLEPKEKRLWDPEPERQDGQTGNKKT